MPSPTPPIFDLVRAALEREPAVVLAYLFGSHARGQAGHGSDVDIAVLTSPRLGLLEWGALLERLQRALKGHPVDLADLHGAPPLLCGEVVREGVPAVVRDPEVRFDFEQRTVRRLEDSRHLRATQQALLREAASDGRPD